MVTHTLIFSFPDDMTEADREQFFSEGSDLVLGSGLAESYQYKRHIPLASNAGTSASPVFTASVVTQIRCASLDVMRRLFAYQPLGDFTRRWHEKFPYNVVSVNTED
jgi:hypothetical protein